MADPTKIIRDRKTKPNDLTYPIDLQYADRNNYMRFILRFNDQQRYLTNSTGDKFQTINLYLPPGALKTSYGQNFSEFAGGAGLEAIGKPTTQAFENLFSSEGTSEEKKSKLLNELKGVVSSENLEAILSSFSGQIATGAFGSLIGLNPVLSNLLGGTSVNDVISATTGYAINPHASVIYQGPTSFRTHGFSFIFYPRNFNEAVEVKNIGYAFKKLMLPRQIQNKPNFSSTFLKHPGTVEISFYVNGKEFDKFKLRKSVLTGLSFDYDGQGGPSFFDDGEPTRTVMNMQFKEIEHIYTDQEGIPSDIPEDTDFKPSFEDRGV